MEQRVAVTLATVWLASIVGASVPSGETTAFFTPRPPGPSPDQYTPLFRNPRYYSQDDYGQDWMNDEPSRIKVANRQENSDRNQKAVTDSDRLLPRKSSPNEFFNKKITETRQNSATPYRFQSNDMKIPNELDREAMRLSSIKVAFDEPIDSELIDNTSQEDWIDDEPGEDTMQQDEFVSDDTFEDEGPGSVEVYKLDLYKDRSILSPKPSRKNYLRNKSKIPKKVEVVDQISWKTKDPDESRQHIPNTVSRFDQHSDQLSPSRYFKDRIFGMGGVPELQVGCEGVEGTQRQKRSDSEYPEGIKSKQSSGIYAGPSARTTPLYLDFDYESEEELDVIGGTDELFKLLRKTSTTTGSPLNNGNRGDMDPRVKTPADLDRPRKKDKFPTRGDLGPSGYPNSTETIETRVNSSDGNQSQVNPRRELLSVEETRTENVRNKRSSDWGYGETEGVMNEHRRRGHRGTRRHRNEKRRRRHEGERERKENEIRKRSKAIDKIGNDYLRNPEDHIGENRLITVKRSQPSDLLRQLPTREDRRNEDYRRHYAQPIRAEERSEKEDRNWDENERKLEAYKRRNTPIQRKPNPKNNHRVGQQQNGFLRPNSNHQAPQNVRLPVTPVHNNQKIDRYAENRRRLQEQRQREVEYTNRATYEQEAHRRQEEQKRLSSDRPQDQRRGRGEYQQRSQQEIQRLKSLPVTAFIVINQEKPDNNIPKIEDRFGGENEIGFPGLNPSSGGQIVPDFPTPATTKPPVTGPSPCVWAIINCCPNKNRIAACFEATGCYHGHWDQPCTQQNRLAALRTVSKLYGG